MTQEEFNNSITAYFPEFVIFRGVIQIEEGEEIPPVYLYFVTGETETLEADNIVYWESTPVTLYIIEDNPDEAVTQKVKEFLNNNRLPYSVTEAEWSDEVSAWLTTFNFKI